MEYPLIEMLPRNNQDDEVHKTPFSSFAAVLEQASSGFLCGNLLNGCGGEAVSVTQCREFPDDFRFFFYFC